nr:PREDICTED: uncharacterized protein KIAA1143 homolog [Paralichthys olivaceus]
MNKSKVSGVSWVKPAEPSFLKRFKNNVGFKDGPTVDTKRDVMPALGDDSGSDREDELPQVVVLKGGDLTAAEVKNIKAEIHAGCSAEKDDGPPPGSKILFKKPAKRSFSDKFQGLTASSSKKKKNDEGEKKEIKSGKKVKNNSLLSFGGDEEKDED